MSSNQAFLTVEAGREGSFSFGSIDQLQTWLVRERETWGWLGDPQQLPDKPVRMSIWHQFSPFYDQIQQAISEFTSNPSPAQLQARVQALFTQFVATRKVAIADSVHGAKILAILARFGGLSTQEAREIAALAQYHVAATDNPAQIGGAYARSAAIGLIAYQIEEGSSRTTEAVVRSFLTRAHEELTARQAALDACQRSYEQNNAAWSKNVADTVKTTDQKVADAIGEIQRVKEIFEKHMGLQAPVQYWTDKAKKHQKLAGDYRNTLIWTGLVSTGICVGSYVAVYLAILGGHIAFDDSVSLALLSFGGLALLTTAALWIARILSRLYLSQHHLGIDADERAVMVTTYLALSNEGAVGEQDRAIVLAALFRPTADGIVKDEAPPVMSPAGFLANLVTPSSR